MGKHFDTLVDIVKSVPLNATVADPTYTQYLEHLLRNAALFDFPERPESIRELKGQDLSGYVAYLHSYLALSAQNGQGIITPFPITAIEDSHSLVILDNRAKGQELAVTMCGSYENDAQNTAYLITGNVYLHPEDTSTFRMGVDTDAHFACVNIEQQKILTYRKTEEIMDAVTEDLGTAALACVQELVFIMDPENFIFTVEPPQYRARRRREMNRGKTNKEFIAKTELREHYICVDAQETSAFLQGTAKEPKAAHSVRGHWRTLRSERFRNRKGQVLFIEQYWTGEGHIEGHQGKHYEVLVKKSPTELVKYSRLR